MWGGLTWIKDNPITQINADAIDGVEMNLWSKDWADGIEMYNMGYDLINTIDDYGYMVPDGSKTRANSYGDLLNTSRIFSSFEPNKLRSSSGYVAVPSGDDQMPLFDRNRIAISSQGILLRRLRRCCFGYI